MRKLVTIRKIKQINPIIGKDRIVQAIIDGWSVIVKKEEFQAEDLCVFFEIDSFLPIENRYSFLERTRKTFKGQEGYRIKTMKMSGIISQGLALPTSMFNMDSLDIQEHYNNKDDISQFLNVIKYDVAETSQTSLAVGNPEGKFPSFLRKTDQERIQNLTHLFDVMQDEEFEETLKLDGSSMTCYKVEKPLGYFKEKTNLFFQPLTDLLGIKSIFEAKPHFGVCSRNLELKRSTNSDFWKAAIKYNIEQNLPEGYALQGELIGPKIQSNHEKTNDLEYYIFDIFNIHEQRYLTPSERQYMMSGTLQKIPHTPIVDKKAKPLSMSLEALLKHVEGESINPGTISEGRVYKHLTSGLTFKVISNKYLLKSEK